MDLLCDRTAVLHELSVPCLVLCWVIVSAWGCRPPLLCDRLFDLLAMSRNASFCMSFSHLNSQMRLCEPQIGSTAGLSCCSQKYHQLQRSLWAGVASLLSEILSASLCAVLCVHLQYTVSNHGVGSSEFGCFRDISHMGPLFLFNPPA